MKTFKQYLTEANRLWNYLYGKHKGIFYRGEKKSGRTGVGFGAMGNGIYLTWDEGMAKFFAGRLGSGGTVKKNKVKSGLKIADVLGKDVIAARAEMGFGPSEYGGDAMYANLMTRSLKRLGYHGVVSDEVAEGIVIFDKKNIKEIK